jgi:probable phosphoglycerate mutase
MGAWEGKTIQELDEREDWRRFNTFRSGTRAPEGELMIEAQTRMVGQVNCLQGRHSGECIALVSHADPLRALLAHFMGIALDLMLRFEISPASVSVVELGDWSPRILCVNETGEIPV